MADIKIPYYPGCSGEGTSAEYDSSTRMVCQTLGVELLDIPDWSCCGSSPAHTVSHNLSAALSGRNLALVEEMGHDQVTTPCPSCLVNLRTAAHKMELPDFREKTNRLLEKPVTSSVEAKSVLQVLFEDVGLERIANEVRIPLKGMKVVTYYGCIMTRPPELMQFDNHENPMSMDKILTALGAEVLPFPLKVECCGASFGVARRDVVVKLSGRLLDAAKALGADAMVTACPLCQMNLDMRQRQVEWALGTKFNMPVFYYTQLLGYAFGLEESELGMDKLCVNPNQVLAKVGR